MSTELDINKVAVDFLQANLERAFELGLSHVKGAKDLVRSKFERTYRTYLVRVLERYSKGKSFFVRAEPVPLYDFFVPLNLATERRVLTRPGAGELADVATAVILSGTGGSGKTMMMRHLLVSCIVARLKTPVFYEVRQQNQRPEPVRTALLETLTSHGLAIDDQYFERALRAGHFSLMLDGFDELEQSQRKRVATEVRQLTSRYPKNWFTMSSRPDPELQGWDEFTQFGVQPLDLASAVELVKKLPFDDPIKQRFIKDLHRGLFQRHASFLSNPLLLSIMLLTYSDVAHIPTKLSIFYTQAYEALFQRHDALKGGFQRKKRSELDIEDFAKVFAAFSIQSYDKRELSFPPTRALELFDSARPLCQVPYDAEAVLQDSLQAVCLLLEEGMDVTFAHRSFQEYFVARFVNSCTADVKRQMIQRYAPNVETDSVIALLHEFDQHAVEAYYVLPAIEDLKRRIKVRRNVGVTHLLRYLQTLYSRLMVRPDETAAMMATISDMSVYVAMGFIYERYQEQFPSDEVNGPNQWPNMREKFVEEFGSSGDVQTKLLTIKSSFVRYLYERGGTWGAGHLRSILKVEETIKQRHKEAKASLDSILNSPADVPRRRTGWDGVRR